MRTPGGWAEARGRRWPPRGRRGRPTPVPLAIVAGALVSALALGACGGDGDEGGTAAADAGNGARGASADGRDAPDPDAIRADVEELLSDHDRVVNQIIADPGVVDDRDGLLVQEYLSLFEPGSEFAEGILDAWAADGAEGISIRPYDDEHPANVTTVDGEIEVVSPDEVRVPFCLEQRQITYRGDQPVQGLPLLERQGESVVVRVDGEWLLRDRNVFGDRTGCGGEAS